MATDLPTNIDATYADRSPGDTAHQQYHDTVHGVVNEVSAELEGRLSEAGLNAAYVGQGITDPTLITEGNVTVGDVMVALPDVGLAHNAFPSLARTADGAILAVWRGGSTHTSTDGNLYLSTTISGRDWTTPVAFKDDAADLRDPCITVLANGTWVVTYMSHPLDTASCKFIKSTDDGSTWSSPVTIPFTGWNTWAFISAPAVELGDGTLVVAAYGKHTSNARTTCRTMRSTDGGATWGNEVTLATGSLDYQEPNLMVTSTGTLRAFIRTEFTTPYAINTATSTDGGLTWSALSPAFNGNGNPHAYRIPDTATVVCVYRDQATGYATVRTSHDDGATWTPPYPFGKSDNYMTYGSVVQVEAGHLLAVWGREDDATSSRLYAVSLGAGSAVTTMGDLPAPSRVTVSPLTQVTKRLISAGEFGATIGSPVYAGFSDNIGWLLDANSTEAVAAWIDFIPPWWATYHVSILWAPTVAASGNVRFDVSRNDFIVGNGVSGGTYTSGAGNLAASPGSVSVRYHRLLSDVAVQQDRYPYIRILRAGAAAEDTYGSDVAFIGLLLAQAS